jgi:hypothetical protein
MTQIEREVTTLGITISALHVFEFGDGFSEGIPKQKPLPNLLLLGDFYKIGGFF